MIRKASAVLILMVLAVSGFGQGERKYIRKGNDSFKNQAYTQSEVNYRKAVDKAPDSYKAIFNVGDALYKQGKYQEAAKKFHSLTNRDLSREKIAKAYHNLGNSLLKSDKIRESIQAYKNALKLNPNDIETKHNLTYALRKLKQNQQQKQNKNKQNNQNNQNQNKENKQNKDQQKQQQDQENQQQNQQKKQDQDKQKQRPQPDRDRISKEDARRLLQALENDEKELQEKLKKKAEAKSAKTAKNW